MKDRRKILYCAYVLICGMVFAPLAIFLSDRVYTPEIPPYYSDSNFTIQPNRLDAFSYIQFDEKDICKLKYSIALESLVLENGSVGPFQTSMFKKAIVRDLQIRLYDYDKPAQAGITQNSNATSQTNTNSTTTVNKEKLIGDTAYILERLSNNYCMNNLNFSNVSEALVNNFDCRFYSEKNLSLSVNAKKAAVSGRSSNMELRGHVTIKSQDGTILESNFVEWYISRNIFYVKGSYILTKNGSVKTGRNTSFNSHLKEEYKCTAKL